MRVPILQIVPVLLFLATVASLVSAAGEDPAPGAVIEYIYKSTPHGDLSIFVHFPVDWGSSDKRSGAVLFHGGALLDGDPGAVWAPARYLASRGIVAARAQYRLCQDSVITPLQSCEDAKSSFRWLRANADKFGLDADRIVGFGGSSGGHLAAFCAITDTLEAAGEDLSVSSRPDILVLMNPILDITREAWMVDRMPGPDKEGQSVSISPMHHVSASTPCSIIFFGSDDQFVQHGRDFAEAADSVGCESRLFTGKGGEHGFWNRSPWFEVTMHQADLFLIEHGFLDAPAGPLENPDVELVNETPRILGLGISPSVAYVDAGGEITITAVRSGAHTGIVEWDAPDGGVVVSVGTDQALFHAPENPCTATVVASSCGKADSAVVHVLDPDACAGVAVSDTTNWAPYNSWGDHDRGSRVIVDDGGMAVHHVALGQEELWLTNAIDRVVVGEGKEYTIRMEYTHISGLAPVSVEILLVRGWLEKQPLAARSFPVVHDSGGVSDGLLSMSFIADTSGLFYVGIRLAWSAQIQEIFDCLLGGISICPEGASSAVVPARNSGRHETCIGRAGMNIYSIIFPEAGISSADLLRLDGSLVHSFSGSGRRTWDIAILPSGAYLLALRVGGSMVECRKICVTH